MKFLTLRLIAFGCFTDLDLDLSKGNQGLHVIHGPNEAGKSTALRAFHQFLFGIPSQSQDNFVHAYNQMRVGATLATSQGRLALIRRKGNKNTLSTSDGKAVSEDVLRAGLGNVDPRSFEAMFAINHARLLEGGQAMLQGDGDVGQLLFTAGAGIANLRQIQEQLQAEARALFLKQGRLQCINVAIADLDRIRQEQRQHELSSSEWSRIDADLKAALETKAELDRQLVLELGEKNRLERIQSALEPAARRRNLVQQLQTLADTARLSADFGQRRVQAVQGLDQAREQERDATSALEELERKRTDLAAAVREDLLRRKESVEGLFLRLGSHQKAQRDRVDLRAAINELEQTARELLRNLRPDLPIERAEELRLGVPQRTHLQTLCNQYQAFADHASQTKEQAESLTHRLDQARKELAAMEPERDVAGLRQAVREAQDQGKLDDQATDLRLELAGMEERLAVNLKRLPGWTGSADELERLAVPSDETIDRFETESTDSTQQQSTLDGEIQEVRERRGYLERLLNQQDREGGVPTEEDLREARGLRDQTWQQLRTGWNDGLADRFEETMHQSDALADRLRREADRVAQRAAWEAERDACDRRLAEAQPRRTQAQAQADSHEQSWRGLWEVLGVTPRSPREMRAWLRQRKQLADQVSARRETALQLQTIEQTIARHRVQLARQLGEDVSQEIALAELVETCRRRIEQVDQAVNKRRTLAEQIDALKREHEEARRKSVRAEEDHARFLQQWSDALAPLGLPKSATPDQVNALLTGIATLFEHLAGIVDKRNRMKGIDSDADRFRAEVTTLAQDIAPDLLPLPVEDAIAQIHERHGKAVSAGALSKQISQQHDREETRLKNARALEAKAEETLAGLCEEAGCARPDELAEAEERWSRRRTAEEQLRVVDEQLLVLAAGAALDEWLAEVEAVSVDELPGNLLSRRERINALQRDKEQRDQEIGRLRESLARMNGTDQALEAAEKCQSLLARIESDAEQYVRCQLASSLLKRGMDRYRERNQGPILTRAGDLFAQLTLGSFEGLRLDFQDGDEAVVLGCRPGGAELVPVHGMSDGTRDQMFLALRLASLEAYLSRHEPIPFIVDDLLIHFDDDRAAATLKVLAELSTHTQILFFTHHDHLVNLARECIEEDVLFVHELPGRPAPRPTPTLRALPR